MSDHREELAGIAERYCETTSAQLEALDPESRAHVLAIIITGTIDLMVKYKGPQATADRLSQIANKLLAKNAAANMQKH